MAWIAPRVVKFSPAPGFTPVLFCLPEGAPDGETHFVAHCASVPTEGLVTYKGVNYSVKERLVHQFVHKASDGGDDFYLLAGVELFIP